MSKSKMLYKEARYIPELPSKERRVKMLVAFSNA